MKRFNLAIIGGIVAIAVGLALVQIPSFDTSDQPNNPDQTVEQEPVTPKLKVIASFYPLYEFSKKVGGDKAEVSSLIPIGVEPHDWEPSTGDILDLKEADLFVYNGGGFEPFVDQLIDSGEYDSVMFVESTKGLELIASQHDEHDKEEHDEHDSEYDPHVWLDPILAKHQVTVIKNAMIQADPQNAQYYETNAEKYIGELEDLDIKIKIELSSCNKDTFMPFHDAFTYFANRYGLKIFALSGIAPESEATGAEIKEFVDFVKKNEITVIFAEELIDPRLAEVLADEAGADRKSVV